MLKNSNKQQPKTLSAKIEDFTTIRKWRTMVVEYQLNMKG